VDARWLEAKAVAHRASDFEPLVLLGLRVDLGRETLWVTIVLYAEHHLILIFRVQMPDIELNIVLIVFILESLNQGFVVVRPHGVADSVVTPHAVFVSGSNVSNQEMLADLVYASEVLFPVGHYLAVNALKYDCLCRRVHITAELLNDSALGPLNSPEWLIPGYCQIAHDRLGEGRVSVSSGRRSSQVVL